MDSLYEKTGDIKDFNTMTISRRELLILREDKARLDWMEQNLFFREKDNFDKLMYKGKNMWVMFAPLGVQGSARGIIDAAIDKEKDNVQKG